MKIHTPVKSHEYVSMLDTNSLVYAIKLIFFKRKKNDVISHTTKIARFSLSNTPVFQIILLKYFQLISRDGKSIFGTNQYK